jgi:Co/Zn/Cd efflux system component
LGVYFLSDRPCRQIGGSARKTRVGRYHLDIIVGFLLAVFLIALCVGFGLAVSTAVTRLLTDEDPGDTGPPDRH